MKKVLIIGNGIKKYIPTNKYDEVVIFNKATEQLFSIATTHVLRTDANCHNFNGNDIKHNLKRIYLAVISKNEKKCKPNSILLYNRDRSKMFNYEGNPSSGYWIIQYYLQQGFSVDVIGFSFRGIDAHNWTFERESIQDDKRVNVIDNKRICHFVYMGKLNEFLPNLYYSLYSFLIHHRHWDVILWTNVNFYKSKELDICLKNGLIINNYNSIAPKINQYKNVGQKVDYIRYELLYRFGGMYCDSLDTITLKNMDRLYDNSNLLNWSWCIGNHSDRLGITYRSGWLCINKSNNPFIKSLLRLNPNNLVSGCDFEHKAMELINDNAEGVNAKPLSYKFVYPIFPKYISQFMQGCEIEFYKQTKQFHYFAGTWCHSDNLQKNNPLKFTVLKKVFQLSIDNSKLRSENY